MKIFTKFLKLKTKENLTIQRTTAHKFGLPSSHGTLVGEPIV